MLGSFRKFLSEMLVHRLDVQSNDFIAFRGHIWFLNDRDESSIEKIVSVITKEHPKAPQSLMDAKDLNDIRDYVPDSITGSWDSKNKILYINTDYNVSPKTSPLVKKVVQTLGVKKVSYETIDSPQGEREVRIGKTNIKGDWQDRGYHGTTSAYIDEILTNGLMPDQKDSNWADQNIHHPDKVFLTNKIDLAKFHAVRTAGKETSKGIPVVIEFKIPDKALMYPDFDIDALSNRTNYAHQYPRKDYDGIFSVDSMRASKHAGVFGYKGRIPASQILRFLVYSQYAKKWVAINDVARLKNVLKQRGEEFWIRYGDIY